MTITLVCWYCKKKLSVQVNRPPQFAYELVEMANEVDWFGVLDMRRHRALVFCCEEHAEQEKTKAGFYRKYPKGVKSENS